MLFLQVLRIYLVVVMGGLHRGVTLLHYIYSRSQGHLKPLTLAGHDGQTHHLPHAVTMYHVLP